MSRYTYGKNPSGDPVALAVDASGNLSTTASGSAATTLADGADVTQGAIADVAVITDAPGTLSAKLRGVVTLFVNLLSRWPAALGQTTMANSSPVTIASNQSAVPIAGNSGAITSGAQGSVDANSATLTLLMTGGYQFAFNGTNWDRLRAVTTMKTAQSTATASGSALALWTPTAGKKFRLREVSGRASIAGRYEIRDGTTTVIRYVYLAANTWTPLLDVEENGRLSDAANNVLNIYNMSGSAADMDFGAAGNEE